MGGASRTRIGEVADAAASLRPFLEPLWKAWRASSPDAGRTVAAASESMCGFTAAFVCLAMSANDGSGWTVRGGMPRKWGGVRGPDGRRHGHFWSVSEDGVLVDLTADQFGMPAVVVTTVNDPRYVESFSDWEIDLHLPCVAPLAEEWMEEAMRVGLAPSPARLVA